MYDADQGIGNSNNFNDKSEADSEEEDDVSALFGIVRKKNGKTKNSNVIDDRDSLPFSVFAVVDDVTKKSIGTFKLDSSTACDDILDLGKLGVYSVQRVSFLYKFSKGKFRVYGKKLDVTLTKESSIITSKTINNGQYLQ